jgi:hypothetical protein
LFGSQPSSTGGKRNEDKFLHGGVSDGVSTINLDWVFSSKRSPLSAVTAIIYSIIGKKFGERGESVSNKRSNTK